MPRNSYYSRQCDNVPEFVIKKKDKAVAIVIVDVRCASLVQLSDAQLCAYDTVNVTRHCIHAEQLIFAQDL